VDPVRDLILYIHIVFVSILFVPDPASEYIFHLYIYVPSCIRLILYVMIHIHSLSENED